MNRRFLLILSAVSASIAVHAGVFFISFSIDAKPEAEESVPVFELVDAVIVEQPEPVFIPPPPAEPEPEIIEELNDAVIPDDEAEQLPAEPEQPAAPVETDVQQQEKEAESAVRTAEVDYLPFYKVEKRPSFLTRGELKYPLQAKRNRIEGRVIIEADIDEEGSLKRVKIVKGAGFGFDEAAEAMLWASSFSPAVMDGRTVAVRMRFTIEFKI